MVERHDDFWNQRLADDFTTSGVGYQALGRPFNEWMYKLRDRVFAREVQALDLSPDSKILDVGSGIGLYLTWWYQACGAKPSGSDLTASAVAQLRERYPDADIHQLDITSGTGPFEPGSYDVVSCMDVLFHITDDELYQAAIRNLSALLKPGGVLVFTENFVRRADRSAHQVNRSSGWITRRLLEAGLKPERRLPMMVLMNAQVDAPRLWRKVWGGFLRLVTLTPATGWVAGAVLYPVDLLLTRLLRRGPTIKLAFARKR